MFCPNCGAENVAGSKFCKKCGQALPESPAEGTPLATAIPPAAPPPVTAAPGPGMVPVPPDRKKSKAWLLVLGLVGLLVVVGVALVLIFVVFKGNGAASGPEKTVEQLLKAVENNDDSGILATIDPAFLREMRRQYGADYENMLISALYNSLPGDNVKFTGAKYQTVITGDTATVTVVDGTLEYTDFFGDRQKKPVDQADLPQFELLKKGDTWYLDFSSTGF